MSPAIRISFVPAGQRARYEAAWGRFCSVFPDMFYKESRGRNYFRTGKDEGRYLSAGFHNVMGYFRDDQPLYELLLDEKQQATLDEMWREMDFVASINIRTYVEFAKLGTRGTRDDFKDGEPEVREIEVDEIISEAKIRKLEADYLEVAKGGSDVAIQAVKDFFDRANESIRWVERARRDAEPSHLQSLFDFAARAYRRPLSPADRDDLLSFYREARERYGLDHEGAIREAIVLVLTSPNFCYRVDLVEARGGIQPLSDFDLASRLSYFLWSSMPDEELLRHAAAGDLHKPEVLEAQARRMLQDPRIRGAGDRVRRQLARLSRFRAERHRGPRALSRLQRRTAGGDVRGAGPLPRGRGPSQPLDPRLPLRSRHVRESGSGPALRHAAGRGR